MIDKSKITLIVTFVIAFITYSFWEMIKEATGIRIFYGGIALSFVGYTYVIYLLFKKLSIRNDRFNSSVLISHIIHLTTVNNLIDELLFDPTKIELNEYVGFVLIIVLTYINHRKNVTRRKKTIL